MLWRESEGFWLIAGIATRYKNVGALQALSIRIRVLCAYSGFMFLVTACKRPQVILPRIGIMYRFSRSFGWAMSVGSYIGVKIWKVCCTRGRISLKSGARAICWYECSCVNEELERPSLGGRDEIWGTVEIGCELGQ